MGAAAGLIPCPSALVVLLAAISQHEVALGMLLIVAFSLGLAGTLTALGLAVVHARRFVPPRLAAGRARGRCCPRPPRCGRSPSDSSWPPARSRVLSDRKEDSQ